MLGLEPLVSTLKEIFINRFPPNASICPPTNRPPENVMDTEELDSETGEALLTDDVPDAVPGAVPDTVPVDTDG